MRAREFPPLWLAWICSLLISSTFFIKLNGLKGQSFYHRQGLRQGDPLSPSLFILTVNSLQCIFQKLQPDLIGIPTAPQPYYNSLMIHSTNIKLIAATLKTFADVSEVRPTNQSQQEWLPAHSNPNHILSPWMHRTQHPDPISIIDSRDTKCTQHPLLFASLDI
jgi:Reverse transcriptase (RNA-dependent DNA polymerase)